MVERCARAALDKMNAGRVTFADQYGAEVAIAVIEVLMEPTDAMHMAGIRAMVEASVVPQIYKAMLSAALSQPNEEGEGK